MNACLCPICGGETFEVRAKLMCRACGAILETCCEGGPMSGSAAAAPPREPSPPVDSPDA